MNYKDIGFKAGLEIHQQLSGLKLFCNCPAINSTKEPDRFCERKLRAVVGETGEIDIAAAHEAKKSNEFVYVGNSEDTCQFEFDEEPPGEVNKEHLKTAIIISKLLNAKIVDEIQVMRKIVINGSNVSGFQRTMLIGHDGYIETKKGIVKVPTILLEEEAAQQLKSKDNKVRYKLDRLGIALLEISTDASLKDPEHVKEVASYIGMVLRSTNKIKRGIGTIRQDVNISIRGGARTEVKGFQDLKSIPKVITKEIERQQTLIKEGKIINEEVRKAEPNFETSFLRPIPGAARLYPETDCLPIKISKLIKEVKTPELLNDKIKRISNELNVSETTAKEIIKKENYIDLFDNFPNIDNKYIAQVLIDIPKDIKTRLKCDISHLKYSDFEIILSKLNKKLISKDSIPEIMNLICNNKKVDYDKFKPIDSEQIETEIKKIIKDKPGLNIGGYMGLVMNKFKGQVDGKKTMEILKKLL